jgi:antitoxin ParD1/3/4
MKVALAPTLEKFVPKKLKTGTYLDASDVIRESLRRWKEQEEPGRVASDWLEQEIQEGLDSPDLPGGPGFWRNLRKKLSNSLPRAPTSAPSAASASLLGSVPSQFRASGTILSSIKRKGRQL